MSNSSITPFFHFCQIGPFAPMDLTSNDLNLKLQEILFASYVERFKPPPVLTQKVFANHPGPKTGLGMVFVRRVSTRNKGYELPGGHAKCRHTRNTSPDLLPPNERGGE